MPIYGRLEPPYGAGKRIAGGSFTGVGPGPFDVPTGLRKVEVAVVTPSALVAVGVTLVGATIRITSGAAAGESVTYMWVALGE